MRHSPRADGLGHVFLDRAPDAEFIEQARRQHAFVVPTLTVAESACGIAGGVTLTNDARLAPFLSGDDIRNLRVTIKQLLPQTFAASTSLNYAIAQQTVWQLRGVGVPILAGTDAPNPGTVHGVSLHRELELLVQAGLAPSEVLAAATFGLADRGRIAIGLRADLLLVRGDPTRDITATRDIAGVWKRGAPSSSS